MGKRRCRESAQDESAATFDFASTTGKRLRRTRSNVDASRDDMVEWYIDPGLFASDEVLERVLELSKQDRVGDQDHRDDLVDIATETVEARKRAKRRASRYTQLARSDVDADRQSFRTPEALRSRSPAADPPKRAR